MAAIKFGGRQELFFKGNAGPLDNASHRMVGKFRLNEIV
jgi:hypothetical protein